MGIVGTPEPFNMTRGGVVGGLPATASEASRRRFKLARAIAEVCPPELAQEIAVTGSTSRGVANSHSDLEINVWTDLLPLRQLEINAWLHANLDWLKGLEKIRELYVDQTPIIDGSVWITFQVGDIWVEMSWQRLDTQSSLVKRLLSGDVVVHGLLMVADALIYAIPLRSSGLLGEWQIALAEYPMLLQDRLIRDAADAWMFPLHVDTCWKTYGEHRLQFLEHLIFDVHGLLRLVFALNRTWEPDWKRLRQRLSPLSIKPTRMISRMNLVLIEADRLEARAACYRLIRDALSLTPSRFKVSRAADIITQSLRKHCR